MQETQEMQVRSLGWKDPLEEEMATHSSIHAWKIPQRSLVGYSPWGRKESDMTDVDLACIHVYIRKYSPFSKEIILDESSQ